MGFPYSATLISCQTSRALSLILPILKKKKKGYIPLKICRFTVRDIIMK